MYPFQPLLRIIITRLLQCPKWVKKWTFWLYFYSFLQGSRYTFPTAWLPKWKANILLIKTYFKRDCVRILCYKRVTKWLFSQFFQRLSHLRRALLTCRDTLLFRVCRQSHLLHPIKGYQFLPVPH